MKLTLRPIRASRMGSHSGTCHPTQVNTPRLNPQPEAGTRFTYPEGMEGWVDLVSPLVLSIQCRQSYSSMPHITYESDLHVAAPAVVGCMAALTACLSCLNGVNALCRNAIFHLIITLSYLSKKHDSNI